MFYFIKDIVVGQDVTHTVHIFYGGVSSHNRTILDASYGGNLMLKLSVDAIKIIEDMCFNPYNSLGDMRIMNKGVN